MKVEIYDVDYDDLSDQQRDRLANTIHDVVRENYGVHPSTVAVMEDEA